MALIIEHRWLRWLHVPERWLPQEWHRDACEEQIRGCKEIYKRALERLFPSAAAISAACAPSLSDPVSDPEPIEESLDVLESLEPTADAKDEAQGEYGLVGRIVRKLLARDRSALDGDGQTLFRELFMCPCNYF